MAADTIPCHWRVPVEFGVYLILALRESQLQLLLASLCIRCDQLGLLLRHGQLVFASLPREYTELVRRHRVRQRPAAAAAKGAWPNLLRSRHGRLQFGLAQRPPLLTGP